MGDVFDNIMLLSDSYKARARRARAAASVARVQFAQCEEGRLARSVFASTRVCEHASTGPRRAHAAPSARRAVHARRAAQTSHWRQYPPGTTTVYSYFESRGGKFAEVTFFGLQYILKRYLTGVVVTAAKIDAAEKIINAHMGQGEMKHFNRAGWEHIVKKHGGRLPIVIKALPEGMTVPVKNVLMTVENTDPECFWLSNYLETLLVQVWYPMTVCTQSREQKKVLADYFQRTGCEVSSPFSLGFQLNDFGTRGVSSMETAALGGAAHLVNFLGSDNMPANVFAAHYYGAKGPAGFSIPAAEHSTITSWQRDGEVDAYRNMLTQYPTGTVAVVSDSYDIFNAVSNLWGGELKEMIVKRCAPRRERAPRARGAHALAHASALWRSREPRCRAAGGRPQRRPPRDPAGFGRPAQDRRAGARAARQGVRHDDKRQGVQGPPAMRACHPGRWRLVRITRRHPREHGQGQVGARTRRARRARRALARGHGGGTFALRSRCMLRAAHGLSLIHL